MKRKNALFLKIFGRKLRNLDPKDFEKIRSSEYNMLKIEHETKECNERKWYGMFFIVAVLLLAVFLFVFFNEICK